MSHPAGGILAAALNGDLAASHGVNRVIQRLSITGQRYFYSFYGQFARRRLAFDTGQPRVGKRQRLVR